MKVICWRIGLLMGLVCLILSTSPAAADEESKPVKTIDKALEIREIAFEGLTEDSEGLIKSIIQTRVGEEISPYQLSQDSKNLYKDTGFFEDIRVDVEPAEEGD